MFQTHHATIKGSRKFKFEWLKDQYAQWRVDVCVWTEAAETAGMLSGRAERKKISDLCWVCVSLCLVKKEKHASRDMQEQQ